MLEAYATDKHANLALLEAMIAENEEYQALADDILEYNSEHLYTPEGAFIVRNAYSNGMLFVKELLRLHMQVGMQQRSQPASGRAGVMYSNSNPFDVFCSDGILSIDFTIPDGAVVSVSVYDVAAREVQRIVDQQELMAGQYHYEWDCSLRQGVHFVQYTLNGNLNVQKVIF